MDVVTLAEHLSVSVRTIERMVKARELPAPIERGGKRLWRWKDVDAHLQQAAEDAVDDAAVVRITQAVRRLRGKT
jgi:excisionase family DNA binding protein